MGQLLICLELLIVMEIQLIKYNNFIYFLYLYDLFGILKQQKQENN